MANPDFSLRSKCTTGFRRIKASAITIRRLSKARWSDWSTSNGLIKRKTSFQCRAVNVRTGQFGYFDSVKMPIRVEHIMASGALPPGFPHIEIDGEYYWDGGLYSNTPFEYVLDYSPRRSRLTFQVDVFQPAGWLPTNLDETSKREKDIRFASRTQSCTDAARDKHHVRHAINELHKLLP